MQLLLSSAGRLQCIHSEAFRTQTTSHVPQGNGTEPGSGASKRLPALLLRQKSTDRQSKNHTPLELATHTRVE